MEYFCLDSQEILKRKKKLQNIGITSIELRQVQNMKKDGIMGNGYKCGDKAKR